MQEKLLINIDYLIVNLEGQLWGNFENSDFELKYQDYGTKIFKNRAELIYKGEKIGTFISDPRSKIISSDLAQLQFENHLFYTKSLTELKEILTQFCDETNYIFKAINRLDIAIDRHDNNNHYSNTLQYIQNGAYLLSGRPKNLQCHYETHKGLSTLNGFSVGKRSSSKMLRVYNKTLSLQIAEKSYINDYYNDNDFENKNVWRFEYQLNSTFFTDKEHVSQFSENIKQSVTWGIFQHENLVKLMEIANTGFFDLHINTGKSQINKEKQIRLFNWKKIIKSISEYIPNIVKRLYKMTCTHTIKKRLAKSLFREYYANYQDVNYIIPLNRLLEDIDILTGTKLKNWFGGKMHFYLHEFRQKEKVYNVFNKKLFAQHKLLAI